MEDKMRNPYVPESRASLAIISKEAPETVKSGLREYIENIIETIPLEGVYKAISHHPDIAMIPVGHKRLVVAPSVYEYYRDKLEPFDFVVIKGDGEPGYKYPANIKYNAAILGNRVICSQNHLDEIAEEELRSVDLQILNVRQGYSKCSLAIIGEAQGITSDLGIAASLRRIGYDVLLIEHGHIRLPGLNYGFIGGSVGLLSESELLIAGSLTHHPSWERINDFLGNYNIRPIQLSQEQAIDIGTILTF